MTSKNNFLPIEIEQITSFFEANYGDFLDFDISIDANARLSEMLTTSISEDLSKHFIIIGRHFSQSLVCYWRYLDKIPIAELPIVWLDSEGSPNSVFASTTREFLSLLPYDGGGIYDFISAWKNYNSEPEIYTCPSDRFDLPAIESYLNDAREAHDDYDDLIDWLKQDVKIKACPNPIELIGESIERFPNLNSWINERRSEKG